MIYNCTMFFNEFKLLELKIAEELPYCDKMIIVESSKTHANKDKPLHLKNHPLLDHPKIIYIDEEEMERRLDAGQDTSSATALIKVAKKYNIEIVIPKGT